MCVCAHKNGGQNTFVESVLPFRLLVGSGDQTRVFRRRCPAPVIHRVMPLLKLA